MTLREQVLRSIERLDDDALARLYEQIQALEVRIDAESRPKRVPTRDEVLEMTASDTSNWAHELIAEREERG